MAQLLSVAWSTTNGVLDGGTSYLNAGDSVSIVYTFDSSPGMRSGDRILLNNGEYASFTVRSGNTATFGYTVTGGSTNTASLAQTSTTIVPGDRTTPQTGFTYATTTSSPSTPIVIDTVAPAAPAITGLSPDTDPVGDHATASQNITLSGTAEPNGTVTITQDGSPIGTATASNSGEWTFTVPNTLADKTNYSYAATSTDRAGNTGSASSPFTVNVDTAICFCAGVMIQTDQGETPVENLKIGDLVMAWSPTGSTLQPIRWIGRQTISMTFADPLTTYPVCISAGALGDGLPVRDLRVSPDHALLLDGALVHATALVNGGGIRRLTRAELPANFTYFHIELEQHGLVTADGALAETFVDSVTRRRFDNWAEYETLFGGEDLLTLELDLPRVMSARQLPASVRARISTPQAA